MKKADRKSAEKIYREKAGGNFVRIDQERRVTADGMLITGLFIKMHR